MPPAKLSRKLAFITDHGSTRVRARRTRRGRFFYGCRNYPDCDFVTWDQPQAEPCKTCGALVLKHHFKNGRALTYCYNDACETRVDHPINKELERLRRREQKAESETATSATGRKKASAKKTATKTTSSQTAAKRTTAKTAAKKPARKRAAANAVLTEKAVSKKAMTTKGKKKPAKKTTGKKS